MVAIASNGGGKQALETVQRLLPRLCEDYGLTPDQVVTIASSGGGKQALEAVQRLLPQLCDIHGLIPDQVAAIASHGGGRQAMETVQRLLPVLCSRHGLTRNQVVSIASHDGGKQALETVERLLPKLCEEHGLTRNHVVAIASNHGGKQALETVERLLPVLCNEHGLTMHQVVAIASNTGGKQALECLFAQLSHPDPALAALPHDRLVALACVGGRPALEAVIKGLPRAATLIRRANRQLSERSSSRVADAAQVVQVLSFFQCHPHPLHAFNEAMQQFGMSRPGLLQLFRRVGVTELEARSGTLPPASQRWQRILHALGGKPTSDSSPTLSQQSWHAFADSLERKLDATSPMHEASQALASSHRKRTRSASSVNRSPQQPAQAPAPKLLDTLNIPPASGWGVKRLRTSISGGLPDPGTPTRADLAASSTALQGQYAATFAGTKEEFPTFNDDEMTWLMDLFL